MKKQLIALLLLSLMLTANFLFAQDKKDDVHLFQAFHYDATIATTPYVDGGLDFASYDGWSSFELGARGGYGINPNLELTGKLAFKSVSVDNADGQSGLTDLLVAGRYKLPINGLQAAAGGYITLPIGGEKVCESHLNFGAFGALRHPLDNGMVITGTLGLEFLERPKGFNEKGEEETEHKSSLTLGGGVIYPVNPQLNVVGELMIKTEVDYMLLSAGGDYKLQGKGRVRGALGLGLDKGAPDFLLMASFLLPL